MSRDLLAGAAALWLAVVLLGQWVFVYYIAGSSHLYQSPLTPTRGFP